MFDPNFNKNMKNTCLFSQEKFVRVLQVLIFVIFCFITFMDFWHTKVLVSVAAFIFAKGSILVVIQGSEYAFLKLPIVHRLRP